ncbi:MAG: Peptide transporter ATP-binding protein [Frankiales bacterium]|nr:Peptide transporter ATP-binding protein [Frankiales bacterium]
MTATVESGRSVDLPLLSVESVDVHLGRGRRAAHILSQVDLTVRPGEILGVIGETGSGKTTLARTVMGLADPSQGEIRLQDKVISSLRGSARRDLRRGGSVQFVFQDPLRSLDPDLTVEQLVAEGLVTQGQASSHEIATRVREALGWVGLDESLLSKHPAQISGGQRQRVSIARALVLRPQLLICDEPVSALDSSNRNNILRLLDELRTSRGLSVIIISHDLSSLAGIADRVLVLYRGRVVEDGPISEVFARPRHPYTALLIASAPALSDQLADQRPEPSSEQHRPLHVRQLRLVDADTATVSNDLEAGCVFRARCRFATDVCGTVPAAQDVPTAHGGGWRVSCHHHSTWRAELEDADRPRVPARPEPLPH